MIYASRFPNPSPRKFGFHELFHVFVTVAIATHYGVVAVYLTRSREILDCGFAPILVECIAVGDDPTRIVEWFTWRFGAIDG